MHLVVIGATFWLTSQPLKHSGGKCSSASAPYVRPRYTTPPTLSRHANAAHRQPSAHIQCQSIVPNMALSLGTLSDLPSFALCWLRTCPWTKSTWAAHIVSRSSPRCSVCRQSRGLRKLSGATQTQGWTEGRVAAEKLWAWITGAGRASVASEERGDCLRLLARAGDLRFACLPVLGILLME